jgi:glycosyltransferase involved in cell wall biosynthesis
MLTYLPLRRLYRRADAIVTYGPHVSAYVSARGARNVTVAPQSVDNEFWRSAPASSMLAGWPERARTRFLFVGRPAPEKGLDVLLRAWRTAGPQLRDDVLALVPGASEAGPQGGARPVVLPAGVHELGPLTPEQLREAYGASDVLVVPSVRTATFREPWGLVVNEAMNGELTVVASDAVGAAAGGLVRDGANGLIVPAGDSDALAAALGRLAGDPGMREQMGRQGAQDVLAYSHRAWAEGFSKALSTLALARERW